jgi:methyl-accepting chemotaxis protein
MKKKLIFATIFLVSLSPCRLLLADPIIIDSALKSYSLGKHVEYLEDREKKLSIDDVVTISEGWKTSEAESFNFGFTASVYWMRFTVENREERNISWYLEIGYPMIDYIDLYIPRESGEYSVRKAGDSLPFEKRDIPDRNFIFTLEEQPGAHTYYLRFETMSSLNFSLIMHSLSAYLESRMENMPIIWIFYGLMIIMVIYNLFLFFFIREKNYIFYVIFTLSYIFIQLTLDGFSFQYLWPNSIWWASNCVPFLISLTCFWGVIFCREYMQVRKDFPVINLLMLSLITISGILTAVALFMDYRVSIKISTVLALLVVLSLSAISVINTIRGSRPARFILIGFTGMFIGVALYVLKTYGVLPTNFITVWGMQIGFSFVVIFLSLGLGDKINSMRNELQLLNRGLEESERESKKRTGYLENIVNTVQGISSDLLNISHDLADIGNRFSKISIEQATSSEEMSASFEELTSSNENISQSTIEQKREGEKTRELANILNETQQYVREMSVSVLESVSVISQSVSDMGSNLKNMIERMELIDEGGKTISGFIAIIDDITDRINLLSLNAAIEAARAGEYGRGFSVVSDEIGKLAQATSDNSKEISGQIRRIISDIDSGIGIVNETKQSTDEIFNMVNTINQKIDAVKELMGNLGNAIENVTNQAEIMDALSRDIAASTNEQNISMSDTLKSVERLSEIAQEIAQHNQDIVDFTRRINEKSIVLDELVKDIN